MIPRDFLNRAHRAALRMNGRRGFPIPAVCDYPAFREFHKKAGRVQQRAADLVEAGESWRSIYRQLILKAREVQLEHLKALANVGNHPA
mgnify:CR=1 FL=1|tara:strand:+ start:10758 stop:11024 length:267 start_codon:yes stop_codon:yes gene_type:complete